MQNFQKTPRGMRHTIVLSGRRNVGKSSLINALTNQETSIVSSIAGTTTDAVAKSYELLPLGAVTFIDTAGIDDDSSLGTQRINATRKALKKADIVIWVVGETGININDKQYIDFLQNLKIPFFVVFNKEDIGVIKNEDIEFLTNNQISFMSISSLAKTGINELKEKIIRELSQNNKEKLLLEGLVKEKDNVILVAPIDSSAPKNRLILPQVQVLRELLDFHCVANVVQVEELEKALNLQKEMPKLIITDSQAIKEVNKIVPKDIPLTTFSILFARLKGDIEIMAKGAEQIDKLNDGDKILIAEACSHHAQDDDIAKVKIPNLISKYTSKKLNFEFCVGCNFPDNLEDYALVVHCGGCMITGAEMKHRQNESVRRGVPITNYGMAISKAQGVLGRVIKPFGI